MTTKDKDAWTKAAAALSIEGRAFIGGKYVAAASGETFDTVNPATGRVIAKIASGDVEDVNRAVAAARTVFARGDWSRMSARDRKVRLVRFAELMDAHAEELALLETLDVGKPIRDSLSGDIPSSVNCLRWFGEVADKLNDEVAPVPGDVVSLVRRQALGVVAAVVPWNFPLLMAVWKIAPVLAAGNSIIIKPAEQSPLTAIRIAELASEAGIPDGVFNVVPGFGETAGRALGMHMDVDAVTFTGSTEVGRYFMEYSGKSNLKRVSLECGGKSPNIVLADAPDLDAAAVQSAWAIYYNQGEVCSAGSRLIVEESIRDEFLEKVEAVAKSIVVGDPLDPATQMGPIVDQSQLKRVMGYIDIGKAEGATLRFGGERVGDEAGNFVTPTLFENVRNDMRIAQEEIFGPVLSVITVKDFDEAIKVGNDTVYGLGAGVWTSNLKKAFKASAELHAGVVWVNSFDAGDVSSPFGGFKQSGFGRDKSIHAIDKYCDLKVTWINLA
jgi:gamma-glutamyl-gamma-aminobutyraldehyde dehydrogenase/4-guanidinobutyraldehyde dehydrogenase/NAD-dependent aldehyde dehydrogenase